MSATLLELPPEIGEKLGQVRGKLRAIAFLHGLWRLLAALIAFVLATYLLDRALDLPTPFRAVLLLGGIAGLVWGGVVFGWRPLREIADDDAIALKVEQEYPELDDSLISAVQLARLDGTRASFQSQALVRDVLAGAAGRAIEIDASRVARPQAMRRMALGALVALAIVGGAAIAEPLEATTWAERMLLLSDTPWPRTVNLEIAMVPASGIVARGDDLAVSATLTAGEPSRVVIIPRYRSGGRDDEIPMVQLGNHFQATFENVTESFSFYVEGGDFRSARKEVQVRQRPKIEELSLTMKFPEYTGETAPEEPQKDGNQKVPAGTRISFVATASEPLQLGEVVFGKYDAVQVTRQGAILASAGGEWRDRKITGEFTVRDSTSWSFHLISKDGFESPTAAQYTIRVVPDRLPEVRIVKPGHSGDASRGAVLALRVDVSDDYKPLAAAIVVQVTPRLVPAPRPAGAPSDVATPPEAGGAIPVPGLIPPPVEKRFPLAGLPPEGGAKQATLDGTLDVSSLGLQPGDSITYWAEAVDNRAPSADTTSLGPENRGKSERYTLRIVSDEDLVRVLQGRLKRLRDELVQTAKQEKSTQDDMTGLAKEIESRAVEAKDRRRLTYSELDQRKVGQRIERARDEFADVRGELSANKVGKPDDIQWLAELEAVANDLAKEKAARAATSLQSLRQADRPDAPKIAEVAALQGEIVAGLEDLVRRLDKWDEFNEVLRDVGDLLKLQQRIQQDTQDRAKRDLNPGSPR